MPTLSNVLAERTEMSPADAEWLHRLTGDWQLLADLSFADLVLWVPGRSSGGRVWVVAAQARPMTGPNFFSDDVVGQAAGRYRPEVLGEAFSGRTVRLDRVPGSRSPTVREDYVPVVRAGGAIGVVSRHADLATMRARSRLELTYLGIADALVRMISEGSFPTEGAPTGVRRGAPRVGDGVIRLCEDGAIDYASPNGVSALRRLGHTGEVARADLSRIVTGLLPRGTPVDEGLPLVLTGRAPWRTEVEARGISVSIRAIPLLEQGARTGALLLLRDVSELRRRERELLSKDATIREIHHRVKNNLQTVAALLRLQSRRLEDPGAREALGEAGRRIATIALVHDTLSQGFDETVPFDEIAVRGVRAAVEVASRGARVSARHTGSFGRLGAEDATPVAMVLAELVDNAVTHGFPDQPADDGPGTVHVDARRSHQDGEELLTVTVRDDGAGLPPAGRPDGAGLGMQIVTALIQDLRGQINWQPAKPRGTTVRFTARLRPLPVTPEGS